MFESGNFKRRRRMKLPKTQHEHMAINNPISSTMNGHALDDPLGLFRMQYLQQYMHNRVVTKHQLGQQSQCPGNTTLASCPTSFSVIQNGPNFFQPKAPLLSSSFSNIPVPEQDINLVSLPNMFSYWNPAIRAISQLLCPADSATSQLPSSSAMDNQFYESLLNNKWLEGHETNAPQASQAFCEEQKAISNWPGTTAATRNSSLALPNASQSTPFFLCPTSLPQSAFEISYAQEQSPNFLSTRTS
uniref:Uncharacterized protein n=1 Tax=Ditylenchus dipsaci TaxID=166011 RepID=A0A915DNR8_9BILA